MNDATNNEPKVFHLPCSGGGCCPDLIEHPDGSIELSEHGQSVTLKPGHIPGLLAHLAEMGYKG